MIKGSKMMRPPSRIHHANRRNPLTDPAKSKSDSPVSEVAPGAYWEYISSKLENPQEVWSDVYSRQIDDFTRVMINLIVLNGGSISEIDLENAFRDSALRDRTATPSNVSDHFAKTLRSAVGSTLSRNLNPRFGTATVGLFNPSISDFALPRLVADRHALSTFLQALKTTRSIDNISSLLENKRVSKETYLAVVQELFCKNLNFEVGSKKPIYFWRLAHLAFADTICPMPLPVEKFVSELRHMLVSELCSGSSMEMACEVLTSLLQMKVEIIPECSLNFLTWAIDEAEDIAEFEKLGVLIQELERSTTEGLPEVRQRYRDANLEHWVQNVEHYIFEDNVLINFLYDEQHSDAVNWAREYIDASCGNLSFTDEEMDKVLDGIDFPQVQWKNQEAAYEGHDDFERPMQGLKAEPPLSPQDRIDDLFDRS